jgi:hypothetical protein
MEWCGCRLCCRRGGGCGGGRGEEMR